MGPRNLQTTYGCFFLGRSKVLKNSGVGGRIQLPRKQPITRDLSTNAKLVYACSVMILCAFCPSPCQLPPNSRLFSFPHCILSSLYPVRISASFFICGLCRLFSFGILFIGSFLLLAGGKDYPNLLSSRIGSAYLVL